MPRHIAGTPQAVDMIMAHVSRGIPGIDIPSDTGTDSITVN